MRHRWMMRTTFISVLLISVAIISRAQPQTNIASVEPSATLVGIVVDTSGAVISKAQITLVGEGKSITATTVENGQFSIPTKSGDYVLKVSSPGFRPYEQVIRWSPSSKGSSEPLFIVLHVSEGGGVCLLPCGGFENPSVPVLQSSLSSMIPLEPLPPLSLHRKTSKRHSR